MMVDIDDLLEDMRKYQEKWKKNKERVIIDLTYFEARILRGTVYMASDASDEKRTLNRILLKIDGRLSDIEDGDG